MIMPDIDFQKIELNLIPKKGDEPVIFYASQYETARPFIADLMWGKTVFEPGDDCRAEIDIRKNDDNLVVITDDVAIDNNEVSVILPVQALTCIGKNLGQVKIYAADDQLIAALNFILEVQPDPLAGGVTSETAIDNLTTQIDNIISGEGYVKDTDLDVLQSDWDEADPTSPAYIKNKPSSGTQVQADWTEADTTSPAYIKNKPTLAAVATSGSYNDLTDKPTIPAAQIQSDWNQTNTSAVDFIKNKPDLMVVKSATGNPCTFETDLADNLVSLTAEIVATGGNGSPDSPIPINGYTEANITRCGVNLWDEVTQIGRWSNTVGQECEVVADNTRFCNSTPIRILPSTQYTFVVGSYGACILMLCDADMIVLQVVNTAQDNTFTTPATAKYLCFYPYVTGQTYTDGISLNQGTDNTYHPYNGQTYTITFGQTVYGGVLDVTRGKLHVTWGNVDLGDLDYTMPVSNTFVCLGSSLPSAGYPVVAGGAVPVKCENYATTASGRYASNYEDKTCGLSIGGTQVIIKDTTYSDASTFKSGVAGVKLIYELATPYDIDLTPVQISALVGTNNITSDLGGDLEFRYVSGELAGQIIDICKMVIAEQGV